jgi:hypothetical protein
MVNTCVASFQAVLLVCLLASVATNQLGDLSNPDDQQIRLVESNRIVEYHKRNYTYPFDNYNPNTPGWKRLMEERFKQVEEIDDAGKRYEGMTR